MSLAAHARPPRRHAVRIGHLHRRGARRLGVTNACASASSASASATTRAAAPAHFINSSYYAADPSAFEFTADGTWSFDYIYVSTVITFFFFAVCSCANAVANKILRAVKEGTGDTYTMR